MIRAIEVIVSPTGTTQVQTKGFSGRACKLASDALEKALGQRTGEQLTPEYFQAVATEQHLQQDQP